ncbi:MAG: hypothetical protein ABI972_16090 [Acidobacteriota bacterium]
MLYAIASYFNPARYRSRLANYHVFRQHMREPLITVELSFDGEFELQEGDATKLIQVRATDVMFQKERLLNLALDALPSDCDAVAWIDCDLLLPEGWAERATEALRSFRLVHLFERHFNMNRDGAGRWQFGTSVARKLLTGEMTMDHFSATAPSLLETTWGGAWAAPRELLDTHRFYDTCVAGSGDVALFSAAAGGFDRPLFAMRMSPEWHRHFLAWARPFHEAIDGRITCLDGEMLHLWHGETEHRIYRERYPQLQKFQFNPDEDLAMTPEGCWRWNSGKVEMQTWIAEYFRYRREDGE